MCKSELSTRGCGAWGCVERECGGACWALGDKLASDHCSKAQVKDQRDILCSAPEGKSCVEIKYKIIESASSVACRVCVQMVHRLLQWLQL